MKNKRVQIAAVAGIVIALIVGMAVGAVIGSMTVDVWDLHATIDINRGINALYEDSSFIVSVGEFSISGCVPFGLCSHIGIDSPWEDFAPRPISDLLYLIMTLFKTDTPS